MTKTLLMMSLALCAGMVATAQGTDAKTVAAKGAAVQKAKKLSLADARAKIDACINEPKTMTETMKALSKADQVAFFAEVNAAIAKMPASQDERTATFVKTDVAAMRGAEKGNLVALVAETFASVPVENLPAVSDTYAEDLFNRGADAAATYSDENFTKIAQKTIQTVDVRCKSVDNAGVRDTLAVLMFIRSSNGTPVNLGETLAMDISDPVARQKAVSTWLPAAKEGDYSAMLAEAGVVSVTQSEAPKPLTGSVALSGPAFMDSLMADLSNETVGPNGKVVSTFSAMPDSTTSTTSPGETASRTTGDSNPSTANPRAPWYPGNTREPGGYQNQTTGI